MAVYQEKARERIKKGLRRMAGMVTDAQGREGTDAAPRGVHDKRER